MGIFGLAISIAAVIWLAREFDFHSVLLVLKTAELSVLAPIPLLIFASFSLRAQRWRALVEHQPAIAYWSSFRALMLGYLLNNLLPARAGDVARALELARTDRLSRTKVLATLVTERTADLAATLLILSAVLLSYPALPEWLKKAGIAISFVTAMAIGVLMLAHILGPRFIYYLKCLFGRWLSAPLQIRLEAIASSALEGIAGMFRPKRAAAFITLTLLIWISEIGLVYLIAKAAGLALAPGNALFVLLVIAIGSMVPASPGFVGTYEFFGTSALGIIGITGAPALAFILLLHAFTLLGSTAIGAVCFALRAKSSDVRRKDEAFDTP